MERDPTRMRLQHEGREAPSESDWKPKGSKKWGKYRIELEETQDAPNAFGRLIHSAAPPKTR